MASTVEFSNFLSYKQMVMELTSSLKILRQYSEHLKLNGNIEAIDRVLDKLAKDSFSIAVIGEFNRGKSTLINALLGKGVLPMDIIPTTATVNRITYDIAPYVEVKFKNGKVEKMPPEKLKEYVTKLTKEYKAVAQSVEEAVVHYPISYCKNNVDIIDTPGLNDEMAMTNVTLSVLPKVDAAIMVMMVQSPFSESERAFLESKVITSDLSRVLFVATGIDLLDEEDVERSLEHLVERIEGCIMAKAAKTMGADSKEYETYKRKIGKVKVYGVAAKPALKGKLKDDDAVVEKSRLPIFEKELERFLTEDRGAVMLGVPVSRIMSASLEVLKAISLRESALQMQKEDFNQKYEKAMKEIEVIKKQRKEELGRISVSAQNTYEKLKPMIYNFWPEIERAAERVIDNFPLTNEEVSKANCKDTQELLIQEVKKETSSIAQILGEQIQNSINDSLEKEVDRLEAFEDYFMEATSAIQEMFFTMPEAKEEGTGVSTTLNYFTLGGGSAYLGFKQAGWKGALIGGLGGGVGTFGGLVASGFLLTLIGLPLTWPVLIVAGIGSALFGTFTGKKAIEKLLSTDNVAKFRGEFKKALMQQFAEIKASENFSEKVRTQIDTAFTSLKDKIQNETDHILDDTQNTLTQLKIELTNNIVSAEKEQEQLQEIAANTSKMIKHAESISAQIAEVVNRR